MTTNTISTSDSRDDLTETVNPITTDDFTLEDVWERRDELIHRGFQLSETALVEALPVTGKSYGVIKWAKETGEYLTVLAPRHDLLDEYETRCEKQGLTFYRGPSFYRDCTSFEKNDKGEYEPIDSAAEELQKEYEQGFNGGSLHSRHPDTSCQSDDECSFVTKRDFEPAEYDVVLGTYRHAYRQKWIEGRYVAIDEFPSDAYLKTFENGVEPVVSAYLEDEEIELPFRDWRDLLRRMERPDMQDTIKAWKNNITWPYDYSHVRRSSNPSAHALAPMATLALLEEERFANNWGYSDLGYGRVAVCNPKKNEWTFLLPPDLSEAESVVALDGTPNKSLWEIVLNEQIETLTLLDDTERKTFLLDVLDYRFVQTTEKWKPIHSGGNASPPKDLALIEGIAQIEERTPVLISSQQAIREYESEGLDEITGTVEHYNNLKGMNGFGMERLGIVLGCPFPRDTEIEKWATLVGESAQRKEINGVPLRGSDTDFGPFGNGVMHTLVHDEVFQAAMRFGREEGDGVRGATVYLHTAALPPWLPVEKQIPTIQSWLTTGDTTHGMRQTIDAIHALDGWRTNEWRGTELYDHTSIRNRTVRDRLDDLAEEGYIQFEGKWGQGTPKYYTNIRLEEAGSFGHVEFQG